MKVSQQEHHLLATHKGVVGRFCPSRARGQLLIYFYTELMPLWLSSSEQRICRTLIHHQMDLDLTIVIISSISAWIRPLIGFHVPQILLRQRMWKECFYHGCVSLVFPWEQSCVEDETSTIRLISWIPSQTGWHVLQRDEFLWPLQSCQKFLSYEYRPAYHLLTFPSLFDKVSLRLDKYIAPFLQNERKYDGYVTLASVLCLPCGPLGIGLLRLKEKRRDEWT